MSPDGEEKLSKTVSPSEQLKNAGDSEESSAGVELFGVCGQEEPGKSSESKPEYDPATSEDEHMQRT